MLEQMQKRKLKSTMLGSDQRSEFNRRQNWRLRSAICFRSV